MEKRIPCCNPWNVLLVMVPAGTSWKMIPLLPLNVLLIMTEELQAKSRRSSVSSERRLFFTVSSREEKQLIPMLLSLVFTLFMVTLVVFEISTPIKKFLNLHSVTETLVAPLIVIPVSAVVSASNCVLAQVTFTWLAVIMVPLVTNVPGQSVVALLICCPDEGAVQFRARLRFTRVLLERVRFMIVSFILVVPNKVKVRVILWGVRYVISEPFFLSSATVNRAEPLLSVSFEFSKAPLLRTKADAFARPNARFSLKVVFTSTYHFKKIFAVPLALREFTSRETFVKDVLLPSLLKEETVTLYALMNELLVIPVSAALLNTTPRLTF